MSSFCGQHMMKEMQTAQNNVKYQSMAIRARRQPCDRCAATSAEGMDGIGLEGRSPVAAAAQWTDEVGSPSDATIARPSLMISVKITTPLPLVLMVPAVSDAKPIPYAKRPTIFLLAVVEKSTPSKNM